MDNGHHITDGMINTVTSIFCAVLAWISLKDAQTVVAMIASICAVVSAIMAIRYYYHATKKIKQ